MPKLLPLVDADTALYRICFGRGQKKIGENYYRASFIEVVEGIDDFLEWIEGMFELPPRLFLTTTGEDNFRYKVATIKPYKSNRHPDKRPPFHKDIREYLINERGAIVSKGCEADDYIASSQNSGTIIVGIDKDFGQIPGYHFNPVKNELRQISEEEAWFNFYRQVLVGDQADSVPGLQGIGEVKSARLLENKTKDQMEEICRNLYCTHTRISKETGEKEWQYGEKGLLAFEEVKQLLWLRRDCVVG